MNPARSGPKVVTEEAWVEHGACRNLTRHDGTPMTDQERADLFYPTNGRSARPAKAICAGCPVRAECLAWAIRVGENFGVWGGTDPRERGSLRAGRPIGEPRSGRGVLKPLTVDDERHGTTNAYCNLGCRCEPCREAQRVVRQWNRARQAVS